MSKYNKFDHDALRSQQEGLPPITNETMMEAINLINQDVPCPECSETGLHFEAMPEDDRGNNAQVFCNHCGWSDKANAVSQGEMNFSKALHIVGKTFAEERPLLLKAVKLFLRAEETGTDLELLGKMAQHDREIGRPIYKAKQDKAKAEMETFANIFENILGTMDDMERSDHDPDGVAADKLNIPN